MKHLKSEFDKLTFKEFLVYVLAIMSMLAGFVLLFTGMFLPPEGQIHQSVLMAFGTICLFAASLLGISIHYANELSKFKSSVYNQLENIIEKKGEATA